MELGRLGFAVALSVGIATVGPYTIADDPAGPPAVKDAPVQLLRSGRAIVMGGPGFVGTPGPGRVGPCIVSARLEGNEVLIEAERAGEAAKASLALVAYKLSGSEMSRMGPMMIEAFRAPVELAFDARTGKATARVALRGDLAGAQVFIQAAAPVIVSNGNDVAVPEQAYVLQIPAEAKS